MVKSKSCDFRLQIKLSLLFPHQRFFLGPLGLVRIPSSSVLKLFLLFPFILFNLYNSLDTRSELQALHLFVLAVTFLPSTRCDG
jgi:hypothetical protein